ncbi:MAG TPA: dihydrofolate reductase [Gemmatimonadales bacterium]|nr:dihydrofolate reductase [Gemmatimonadales bacterium]
MTSTARSGPVVSLIAAMARNRVIGRGGALPWHLPDDQKFFRKVTLDHTVIMGRKTFDEIRRPLANRRNVVISRNPDFHPAGVTVVPSLEEALALGATEDEVFVIGGGEIYREALPQADRLYLTVVEAEVDGDTTFPPYASGDWALESEEYHPADDRHAWPFTIRIYRRIARPASS